MNRCQPVRDKGFDLPGRFKSMLREKTRKLVGKATGNAVSQTCEIGTLYSGQVKTGENTLAILQDANAQHRTLRCRGRLVVAVCRIWPSGERRRTILRIVVVGRRMNTILSSKAITDNPRHVASNAAGTVDELASLTKQGKENKIHTIRFWPADTGSRQLANEDSLRRLPPRCG